MSGYILVNPFVSFLFQTLDSGPCTVVNPRSFSFYLIISSNSSLSVTFIPLLIFPPLSPLLHLSYIVFSPSLVTKVSIFRLITLFLTIDVYHCTLLTPIHLTPFHDPLLSGSHHLNSLSPSTS